MNFNMGYIFRSLLALATLVAAAQSAALPGGDTTGLSAKQEISTSMEQWITAVAGKQKLGLADLVDSDSEGYYRRLRGFALTADATELSKLSEVDQLQVMFFRLMIDAKKLRAMRVQQLIGFAVEKGFIGMELRGADQLDEIELHGDSATGRLLKFGRTDRPDPYLQYFVKEQGAWLVSLRGERERLEGEFNGFVQRSGLSRSEAAFLILEMRMMRKVKPSDFFATPKQMVILAGDAAPQSPWTDMRERFRLVSVRLPESLVGRPAATLDDTGTGLKYVLRKGDSIPGYPDMTLRRIAPNEVMFDSATDSTQALELRLDSEVQLSSRGTVGEAGRRSSNTMLDEAALGEKYQGQMMIQWRNIGLRGRPQLLQQAWLTPDFGGVVGPKKTMLGLKVSQIMPASFWDQIGLEEGDLLTEVNGMPVNTLDAWKKVIQIAQTQQELHVRLQRGDLHLAFRTATVRPG